MSDNTQTGAVEDFYSRVKSFEYMVNMESFPEGEREYDLSKADAVLAELLDIVQQKMPAIEDCWLYVDRSDYATRGTQVVGFTDLTPEEEGDLRSAIEDDMFYHWVPEAMERAGVVEDEIDPEGLIDWDAIP